MIGNLLGVPQDEREPLRGWSLAILGALEPVISAGSARGNRAVAEFLAYLEGWSRSGAPSPAIPSATC